MIYDCIKRIKSQFLFWFTRGYICCLFIFACGLASYLIFGTITLIPNIMQSQKRTKSLPGLLFKLPAEKFPKKTFQLPSEYFTLQSRVYRFRYLHSKWLTAPILPHKSYFPPCWLKLSKQRGRSACISIVMEFQIKQRTYQRNPSKLGRLKPGEKIKGILSNVADSITGVVSGPKKRSFSGDFNRRLPEA